MRISIAINAAHEKRRDVVLLEQRPSAFHEILLVSYVVVINACFDCCGIRVGVCFEFHGLAFIPAVSGSVRFLSFDIVCVVQGKNEADIGEIVVGGVLNCGRISERAISIRNLFKCRGGDQSVDGLILIILFRDLVAIGDNFFQ